MTTIGSHIGRELRKTFAEVLPGASGLQAEGLGAEWPVPHVGSKVQTVTADRAAVAAVFAVFAEFDPQGRRSVVINEQSAVIRRVPAWKAEEVAVALVKIACDCRPEADSVAATCESLK